jgi:hypothetical protein
MGSVGTQGAAKHVTEIVDVFKSFFTRDIIDMAIKETNR